MIPIFTMSDTGTIQWHFSISADYAGSAIQKRLHENNKEQEHAMLEKLGSNFNL